MLISRPLLANFISQVVSLNKKSARCFLFKRYAHSAGPGPDYGVLVAYSAPRARRVEVFIDYTVELRPHLALACSAKVAKSMKTYSGFAWMFALAGSAKWVRKLERAWARILHWLAVLIGPESRYVSRNFEGRQAILH